MSGVAGLGVTWLGTLVSGLPGVAISSGCQRTIIGVMKHQKYIFFQFCILEGQSQGTHR